MDVSAPAPAPAPAAAAAAPIKPAASIVRLVFPCLPLLIARAGGFCRKPSGKQTAARGGAAQRRRRRNGATTVLA